MTKRNFMPALVVAVIGIGISTGSCAQETAWPDRNPEQWVLAFVDVETTGLIPGYHEMIDIGIVMTTLDGDELGELFLRIQPRFPERTDDGARAVNAFYESRWQELGAVSPTAAVEDLIQFRSEIAAGRDILMVAFNSPFDTAFLDHLFRSAERRWRELFHYFVLDVPSMAWGLGIHGLTGTNIATRLGIEDEPHVAELHTGITGARLNARIYRALLDYRKSNLMKSLPER